MSALNDIRGSANYLLFSYDNINSICLQAKLSSASVQAVLRDAVISSTTAAQRFAAVSIKAS